MGWMSGAVLTRSGTNKTVLVYRVRRQSDAAESRFGACRTKPSVKTPKSVYVVALIIPKRYVLNKRRYTHVEFDSYMWATVTSGRHGQMPFLLNISRVLGEDGAGKLFIY